MFYVYDVFSLFIQGCGFFHFEVDLVIEWLLYRVNRIIVESFILLDWISILFMSFVLLISSMVILYRVGYMEGDKDLDRFVALVMLFVVSMLMIILSPRLIRVLFGWYLLELVSYCFLLFSNLLSEL